MDAFEVAATSVTTCFLKWHLRQGMSGFRLGLGILIDCTTVIQPCPKTNVMSSTSNPYQSRSVPSVPPRKRSVALFVLVVLASILLMVSVPIARVFLLRIFDEFELVLPALALLIVSFYPELIALPLLFAALLVEFIVPNATAKNYCNLAFLGLLFLLFCFIAVGLGLPLLQAMNAMT